jgi:hypothetical protein
VIFRALARKPRHRFSSTTKLEKALSKLLDPDTLTLLPVKAGLLSRLLESVGRRDRRL